MIFEKIAKKALGDSTFDWAIPQSIYDENYEVSGHNPNGHIVWSYENNHWGEPYSLTMLGWIILRLHQLRYGR